LGVRKDHGCKVVHFFAGKHNLNPIKELKLSIGRKTHRLTEGRQKGQLNSSGEVWNVSFRWEPKGALEPLYIEKWGGGVALEKRAVAEWRE